MTEKQWTSKRKKLMLQYNAQQHIAEISAVSMRHKPSRRSVKSNGSGHCRTDLKSGGIHPARIRWIKYELPDRTQKS